MWRPDDTAVH